MEPQQRVVSCFSVRPGEVSAPAGDIAGMLSFAFLRLLSVLLLLGFYIDLGKHYLRVISLLSLGYIFRNFFMSFACHES